MRKMASILLKNTKICDVLQWNAPGNIMVEDGLITGVGNINPPVDKVIDMAGHCVLPGLIDAHVHLCTGDFPFTHKYLQEWAQCGVTTVRDMGYSGNAPISDYFDWLGSARKPNCAGVVTCGRPIAAKNGNMHLMTDGREVGIGVETPREAIAAVDAMRAAGADGIKLSMDAAHPGAKINPVYSPETLSALTERASELGLWCSCHVLDAKYVLPLFSGGVKEFAHMPLNSIPDVELQEMVRLGTTVTATLCTINIPRPPLPPGEIPPDMLAMIKEMDKIDTAEQERIAVDNARRFYNFGGRLVVGTDTMRMETQLGAVSAPVRELRLLYKAGLSLQDVIAAVTINAAKACGLEGELGSLTPGKRANIIATRGDIDASFAALENVDFVMNMGVIIK